MLGKSDDDLVERVRKAQPRLPPTKIARDGSIMEWVREKIECKFQVFYFYLFNEGGDV